MSVFQKTSAALGAAVVFSRVFSVWTITALADGNSIYGANQHGEEHKWEVHAAYDCALPDRKNASKWLDFGWDLIDVLHFGGPTLFVQMDGSALWKSTSKCNPVRNSNEAALIAHAHANELRVLLAVHFNNSLGADMFFHFLNDDVAMKSSAHNICAKARENDCDGISLDFEVLNTRFNTTFKGLYARYITILSKIAQASRLTVTPTLFMDLPKDAGVDARDIVSSSSDGAVLMAYDYHWGCSDPAAGPNTPLIGNNGSNVNASVMWALQNNISASNLLLGVAWYGREYPTTGPEYGAPTNCTKVAADQIARAYQAPLALHRAQTLGLGGVLWDESTLTPWYHFKDAARPWLWWEGYFDNFRSISMKYDLVTSQRLRGILIWMLNGCTRTEAPDMWRALARARAQLRG